MHNEWGSRGFRRRGAVLILVLAVLLVLALVGTVFVTFQGVERLVSRSFSDEVRARMMAESGMEQALAELRVLMLQPANAGPPAAIEGLNVRYDQPAATHRSLPQWRWTYFGDAPDIFSPPNPNVILEDATHPSLSQRTMPAGTPVTMPMDGAPHGYSGAAEYGTYGPNTDLYSLRITEESGKINVNDGVTWGPTHSITQNMTRILNELGKVTTPLCPNLGTILINNRPSGSGYVSKLQIRGVMLANGFSDAQFRAVSNHVTVSSWSDDRVALPVPLSAAVAPVASGYYRVTYTRPVNGGQPVYRYGHDRNYRGTLMTPTLYFYGASAGAFHNAIYDHQALNPVWIEVASRAPVNVNSASREVLIALLTDLRGFFADIEPRRELPQTVPSGSPSNYRWLTHHLTYDQTGYYPNQSVSTTDGTDGDEAGMIYTTMRYWSTANGPVPVDGISAQLVADEILACRLRTQCSTIHTQNGTPTAGHTFTDYRDVAAVQRPFFGPFRNWMQFHAFVDYLVDIGVIRETRATWFQDYFQSGGVKSEAAGSWIQMRMASEAAGDVLKANFNPNLHLNELNPDRQLYTHVDKTDLLVNSTEFCFLPMNGAFEIESLGRILRPTSGVGQDALTAPDNQIVAEKKLVTVISLWNAVRESTQDRMYNGTFGARAAGAETSYNYAVNTGPEPDQGPMNTGGWDMYTRWDGHVQLATYGGTDHTATGKPKNVYRVTITTPGPGTALYPGMTAYGAQSQRGATIHAHYDLDATAHYHRAYDPPFGWSGFGAPVGAWSMIITSSPGSLIATYTGWDNGVFTPHYNDTARTENYPGPYVPPDYLYTAPAHRYRECRSFTLPNAGSFTFSPALTSPSDLRLDGIYLERHSSFGYFIWDEEALRNAYNNSTYVGYSTFRAMQGAACFWLKPNWFPECTGKVRTLFSIARGRIHCRSRRVQSGNTLNADYTLGYDHNSAAQPLGACVSGQYDCNYWSSSSVYQHSFQPFTLYCFPSGYQTSGSATSYEGASNPPAYTLSWAKLRPCSLGFGMGVGRTTGLNWDIFMPRYGWDNFLCDAGFQAWFAGHGAHTNNSHGSYGNYHGMCMTDCLNHEDHGTVAKPGPLLGRDGGFNYLRGHEWVHLLLLWRLPAVNGSPQYGASNDFQIFVNGNYLPNTFTYTTSQGHTYNDGYSDGGYALRSVPFWWVQPGLWNSAQWSGTKWSLAAVTLGGETDHPFNQYAASLSSTVRNMTQISTGSWGLRNYTADSTFDEFYMWTNAGNSPGQGQYEGQQLRFRGRFYRPDDANLNDAIFTSQVISIPQPNDPLRAYPPSCNLATVTPPVGPNTTTTASPAPISRLIGVSWTQFAEGYNPPLAHFSAAQVSQVDLNDSMVPYIRDWNNPGPMDPHALSIPPTPDANNFRAVCVADMYVVVGANVYGPFRNDHFSPVLVNSAPVNAVSCQYRAKLKVGPANASSAIHATPVLDDVTMFYDYGGPRTLTLYWVAFR